MGVTVLDPLYPDALRDEAIVQIHILDSNDHAPVFSQLRYIFTISKKSQSNFVGTRFILFLLDFSMLVYMWIHYLHHFILELHVYVSLIAIGTWHRCWGLMVQWKNLITSEKLH